MVKLPRKISLFAMRKVWKISYIKSPGKLTIIEHPYCRLAIYGRHLTKLSCLTLLTKWVRLKANDYLSAYLLKLNRRVKAKYKKVVVRPHTARWGSCTPRKIINLNYQLIFLPEPLVKCLILHELCHLKFFNHSNDFWKELEKYDSNYKKHDALLNEANKYLPEWLVL